MARIVSTIRPSVAWVFAAAALVSGCQSSPTAGVDTTAPPPPQEKVLASELRAFCPGVTIRSGTANYSSYAKGGTGDSSKIIHQASITDASRSCSRADGQMTIKIGVTGRLVPGPMAQTGSVNLPIRIAVSQGSELPHSQLYNYQATVSDTTAATQFLMTEQFVIPIPADGSARIFVGFDEGPVNAGKPSADES